MSRRSAPRLCFVYRNVICAALGEPAASFPELRAAGLPAFQARPGAPWKVLREDLAQWAAANRRGLARLDALGRPLEPVPWPPRPAPAVSAADAAARLLAQGREDCLEYHRDPETGEKRWGVCWDSWGRGWGLGRLSPAELEAAGIRIEQETRWLPVLPVGKS